MDHQPSRPSQWSATFQERRTALFIAAICIVVIGAAMLAPQWFKSSTGEPGNADSGNGETASTAADNGRQSFHIASEAPVASVSAQTPVGKAAPSPVPRTEAPAVEQPAPAHEPVVSKPVVVIPVPKPKPVASKPVASRQTAAPKPAISQPASGYYVQVGAFKERALANTLKRKLTGSGYNCRLIDRGNGMVGVWVGPESDRESADKLQQDLQLHQHMQGFVTHSG